MGKQAQRAALANTALANALNTSGTARAAPVKKEPVKEPPPPAKKPQEQKEPAAEPARRKTKQEIEEERQRLAEAREEEKRAFFRTEAEKKAKECKPADLAVTYVEDRDTKKPKAVNDISEYWVTDLGVLPFMPGDNAGPVKALDGIDIMDRLEYLRVLNDQLRQLLRMRFNVFWSQAIFDGQLRRCIDSYLRFCLRSHDVDEEEVPEEDDAHDLLAQEETELTRSISRRMLMVITRLSRPQETAQESITSGKFAEWIYEYGLFDVPKLIDICAIYGDSNRETVTRIVHSVFTHQSRYKEDFASVVGHMLTGLQQCCEPLQSSSFSAGSRSKAGSDLSVEDALTFLPDILSCFIAMFCYFPEECVQLLLKGHLDVDSDEAADGVPSLPLADLMVPLHDAVSQLKERSEVEPVPGTTPSMLGAILSLLSRFLSCVLGFRMAPRRGAAAFEELLEWLRARADRTSLLQSLGRHGMEHVAMEWIASGLVDDDEVDYLEMLCGQLVPKEARATRRRAAALGKPAAQPGAGAVASSSSSTNAGASNDVSKIREIKEVVGPGYGDGFLLQCLLHYSGSVPGVVGAILDGALPPQLAALPTTLSLNEDPTAEREKSDGRAKLSAEDKRRIMEQTDRMRQEEIAREEKVEATKAAVRARATPVVKEYDEYDDEHDDTYVPLGYAVRNQRESDAEDGEEEAEEGSSDGDGADPRWSNGKGGHKGKGKGKGRGPVAGGTVQARRKEAHKAQAANHNRRAGAMRKMQRGML